MSAGRDETDTAIVDNLITALRRRIDAAKRPPEAPDVSTNAFVIALPSAPGPPWDVGAHEVMTRDLTPAERMLITTEECDASVCNGGSEGYFDNPGGVNGELAIDGFNLIGDDERAGLVGAAVDRLLREMNWHRPLDELSFAGRDLLIPHFKDLEDAWYDLDRTRPFRARRSEWIASHARDFSDFDETETVVGRGATAPGHLRGHYGLLPCERVFVAHGRKAPFDLLVRAL